MTPAPSVRHQIVSDNLFAALHHHVTEHRLGLVLAAPSDVYLSHDTIVQSDLVFVSTARLSIVGAENIQGPPDLAIQILSPSTRIGDEVTKRDVYERFGVQEYWIADPDLQTAKIFRLQNQRYGIRLKLARHAGPVLTTPLVPGFELWLSVLFA